MQPTQLCLFPDQRPEPGDKFSQSCKLYKRPGMPGKFWTAWGSKVRLLEQAPLMCWLIDDKSFDLGRRHRCTVVDPLEMQRPGRLCQLVDAILRSMGLGSSLPDVTSFQRVHHPGAGISPLVVARCPAEYPGGDRRVYAQVSWEVRRYGDSICWYCNPDGGRLPNGDPEDWFHSTTTSDHGWCPYRCPTTERKWYWNDTRALMMWASIFDQL